MPRQAVLRELQAYVSWHSHPAFVALSVQAIAHVALKISSVADSCLRGLVKMLDSKCEARTDGVGSAVGEASATPESDLGEVWGLGIGRRLEGVGS